MTENEKLVRDETEAIECLKSNKPTSGYLMLQESIDMAIKALEEIQKYRKIGTVEECRAAMEKQTAKKPMHVTNSYFGYQKHKEQVGYCPDCGHQVEEPYGCPNCLRKIDWGDEE